MRVVRLAAELREILSRLRCDGASIALVPTMGALHAGHESLLLAARRRDDVVVASVFVNPLQFDSEDDLERYPRDLAGDEATLERSRADLCFAPSVGEMYPGGAPVVRVDPGELGSVLEGASRPGHLAGVATVVAKLFTVVAPDTAYFGEKDFQQLVLVRRLARDLSFPVEVVGCPTVREPDGLAWSSRNARLSPAGRAAAPVLHRALLEGAAAWRSDGADAAEEAVGSVVRSEPLASLDYAVAVDGELTRMASLPEGAPAVGGRRLLVAATLDGVRLVDNLEVTQ